MKAKTIRLQTSVQAPGGTTPCGAFHLKSEVTVNIPSERLVADIDVGDVFVKLTDHNKNVRYTTIHNVIDFLEDDGAPFNPLPAKPFPKKEV